MVKQPDDSQDGLLMRNVLVMEMLTLRKMHGNVMFSAYMNKHAAAAIVDLSNW
jgi:hypothetical protein